MAKTSKGVILSQVSQIKSDYSFALIKATADNKSLVQDASSAELKVNALVEYSKDSQWDPKKLTSLGFPAGCFLIVDLRGQDIHASDLITNLALVRQYGYQAGVIDDLSTLDDIKALKANQIYLINSGKANDDQDASLNGDEITDGSGKLAVGMSVKWQRDYTNVDVSSDHAGFVGMGQDTLLKGGNAFGYSTNGRDFNAVITPKGLIFRRPDAERMWRLLKPKEIADINSTVGDKVKKEVDSATAEIPAAVSAANSAVSAAESAVAASKVNSDAIVAQSEAISEAKSTMDSATAEIQQTIANTASDVAQIRADVARVQNEVDTAKSANSASVEALKSDINTAKQDLADVHDSLDKAQSAIEQNQKAINDSIAEINANVDATNQDLAGVRKDLTKAQSDITANQKAVNDNVAQINSNIEQDRKDIASAQQANADTAKQLDTYSKQATEQGKTIKTIQDKQDGFTATLADVQGNVSQVSDKVDGLSASLKDTQGNVASVKAQADQLSTTLTNHGKSIATLTASAKELSSTLEDADGRLSKVEQTVQTNSSTLSDVQGDLSQVKQNATKLVSTLKDAQGNISTLQQKADSVSTQLATAQGDIATLQTGVDSVKAILTSHDKSIHTLQADSKSLKDSMVNAQGDISTLRKTATDVTSELEDHTGRLSKVEQSAAKQAITLSDLQGNLSQVEQKADSNTATISSINKNAMQDRGVITDTKTSFDSLTQLGTYSIKASGLSMMPEQHYGTLVVSGSAGSGWLSQQFVADTTGNVYTRVFSNNAWSAWKQGGSQDAINQVKQTADSNSATIRNVQGDVNTLKQTATGVEVALADHEGDIHTLQADSKTLKDDMADAKGNISSLQKTSTSLVSEFRDHDGRLSKVEQTATEHTSELADAKGNIDKVTQKANALQLLLSDAQKNIQNIQIDAKGIHDTLTGQGNQLATLNITVNNFDSKYSGITGDLKTKQASLSTEQLQTKDMLLRKADKSEVDNVKGTVSKVSAEQKVMADQISQKVSSTEYQTLKDKVNGLRIGTRNLLHNTSDQYRTLTGDGYLCQSTASDVFTSVANYHGGDSFTYAATITNHSTKNVTLETWLFNQSKQGLSNNEAVPYPIATHSQDVSPGESNKRVSTTFQISGATWYVRTYVIFDGGGAPANSQVQVKDERLVEGNIAGTWEANPNDTIASIQKNATAIDETSKLISLMAKQTEVDNVKNTSQQLSSRLDVMADQIKSKVTSTDVNNIVDGKGYATTSTVQSLITQKAGTINESITNLDAKYRNINGVNLVHNSGFHNVTIDELKNSGWYINDGIWINKAGGPNKNGSIVLDYRNGTQGTTLGMEQTLQLEPDTDYTLSLHVLFAEMAAGKSFDAWTYFVEHDASGRNVNPYVDNGHPMANSYDRNKNTRTFHTTKNTHSGILCLRANPGTKVELEEVKLERGKVESNTAWTPAPSDNATVTQIQSITASIDGLQSNVTNLKNDTSSRITQLSNTFQSKIGDAQIAINDLKDKTLWKITDSVDLNNVVTQQKIFVKGGSNLPPGGYWWYVQVEPGYDSRIVQYAVSDRDNLHYSRQYDGSKWSAWSQGATESEITQLRDDINLRVKSGDLLSQINLTAGNTLIQSNKLYLDASSVVFSGRAFIPSAAISELDADKLTFYGNGSKASIGAGIAQYDQDKIKSTINLQYQGGFEIHSSNQLGSILTMHDDTVRLASRSQTFSAGSGKPLDQQYSGFWAGSNHALINAVDSEGKTTGWSIGPSNSNGYRAYLYDSSTSVQPNFGVGIGTQRFDVYAGGAGLYLGPDKAELRDKSYTTIHSDTETFIEGGNQQIYMHNGEVNIGNPNDTGNATGVHLRVFGWASFNGYVEGMGWTTKSTLSSKTRIEKLDTKDALNKIMETDLETYQYKAEVAGGMTKRHAGPIIDDVHDVAQYSTPDEFINERRTGRSDADVVGYLMGAVQELKKQLDEMKKEVQING